MVYGESINHAYYTYAQITPTEKTQMVDEIQTQHRLSASSRFLSKTVLPVWQEKMSERIVVARAPSNMHSVERRKNYIT